MSAMIHISKKKTIQTKQMTSFKIYFSEENIRRIRLPEVPSYEKFMNLLQESYPANFHIELSVKYIDEDGDKISVDSQMEWEEMIDAHTGESHIKLYVEEGEGAYFKDGPHAEPLKFYVDEMTKEAINTADEVLAELQKNVSEVLESVYRDGRIIPDHIPEFLKDALTPKYLEKNVVDLDVNIPLLFDSFHSKALQLLDSVDASDLEKAKDYFLASLQLFPEHMIALYNLACTESLLGNVQGAVENLEKAVNAGYRDLSHMLQDADLDNIKNTEAFQIITAKISSLLEPEQEVVAEETVVPEPSVETVVPEPELETPVPEPEIDLSASILPLQENYGSELNLLKEMGFSADTDVLLLLLEQYKGHVEQVADFLFGFQQQ
eukprot:TRINITY_DN204_c0_g1_i1.p1 TRINITY_DN204_c0_g1~~TRINITY_DN204_c0_g1_i1.p1  ORF type:complete len:379 (+),score=123.95 TRINITY_DN204_c0_g1_i1:51-1187(+)